MRVDGVMRNLEPPGYPRLREIIEDALDDLQFPFRQVQLGADLMPGAFAEQRRSARFAVRNPLTFDGQHTWRLAWVHGWRAI